MHCQGYPCGRAVFVPLLEGGGPESLGKSDLNFERRSRNDKSFERVAAPSEKTKIPGTAWFLGNSVARQEGLEPPTFWFVAKHSIQLSYWRIGCSLTALLL